MDGSWHHHLKRPREIAAHVLKLCGEELETRTPRLTLLIGSGFSVSAGIPTAGGIVREYLRPHALLQEAGAPTASVSEYAHLMGRLPPADRMEIIEACIAKAQRGDPPRTQLNWAHLLTATLVYHRFVKQILTTNFDPLLIDAMAITDQPVRTFDLTAADWYMPGRASRGALMYLHGQSHGLLQTHTPDEAEELRKNIRSVLQDALQDSTMLVIGYSGECDLVFDELRNSCPQFRNRVYWVHYDPETKEPPKHVQEFICKPGREAFLVCDDSDDVEWMDSDTAMHRLVIDELELQLPPLVANPLDHVSRALDRLSGEPKRRADGVRFDPAAEAKKLVARAQRAIETKPEPGGPASGVPGAGEDSGVPLEMRITFAAMTANVAELRRLRPLVESRGDEELRHRLGDGFRRAAAGLLDGDRLEHAISTLEEAEALGTTEPHWLANNWGTALSDQAKKRSGEDADRLFAQAGEKYAEALRLTPDMHEALYNWGTTLSDQARMKSGEDADRLFAQAGEKYAEALRIKADMHEALSNWGVALSAQAQKRSGEDADRLLAQAGEKFAEALRIKPGRQEVLSNWGVALSAQAQRRSGEDADRLFAQAGEKYAEALRNMPASHGTMYNFACLEALQGRVDGCLEWLAQWAELDPKATREEIDKDTDFDAIRADPRFVHFLDETFSEGLHS